MARPRATREPATTPPAAPGEDSAAPAPPPVANRVLADIALRSGVTLLRRAIENGLLEGKAGSARTRRIIKGGTLGGTVIATAAVRIATRSIPGAILVGGGLVAKALYDRRRRKAREPKE
jgi:hypothetical protein